MTDYKNSQTEKNLKAAFAGESQARNRYSYFAAMARQEGLTDIANTFESAAENERYHAKIWFEALQMLHKTDANLEVAIANENEEADNMYIEFARIANAEGFPEIAAKFEQVAAIERGHEAKFSAFLEDLRAVNKDFSKLKPRPFRKFMECKYCGNITNTTVGSPCPVCSHVFEQ